MEIGVGLGGRQLNWLISFKLVGKVLSRDRLSPAALEVAGGTARVFQHGLWWIRWFFGGQTFVFLKTNKVRFKSFGDVLSDSRRRLVVCFFSAGGSAFDASCLRL